MKKFAFTIWVILIVTVSSTTAQKGSFFAQVSSDTILAGNAVQVTFVANNVAGKFTAPRFENLQIISGPNTSTSMSMVNGAVNQSASYTYILNTDEIGAFVIPPGYLDTADGALETEPIEIFVVPNPEGIIEQRPSQSGFFEFNVPSRSAPVPPTAPEVPNKKKRKLKKI